MGEIVFGDPPSPWPPNLYDDLYYCVVAIGFYIPDPFCEGPGHFSFYCCNSGYKINEWWSSGGECNKNWGPCHPLGYTNATLHSVTGPYGDWSWCMENCPGY